MLPIIAISIGDIYGIGPEVILKAFDRSELFEICRPAVFAPAGVLEYYRDRYGVPIELSVIDDIALAREGVVNTIVTAGNFDIAAIGHPTVGGGRSAIAAIEAAFATTHAGVAQAMVTAPVSKEAIALAGSPFRGHTEMLAALCGTPDDVLMILSSNTMNVGLVTIHVPLAEVAAMITGVRVRHTIRLAHRAMRKDYGIEDPKLAILALNPHAGDGGLLGGEEQTIIAPAVSAMQEEGIDVAGPFAADGFFSAHTQQMYDIIIAMYHDQGLVPFKLQAMGRGVNVTVGLPIVRTSPDHGTAYNIAGHGLASAASMKEAISFARAIALNRAS